MNILVTGGAGFIGSNLVERLLKEGNKVTVIDNLSTGRREFLKEHLHKKNFRLVIGDILKRDDLNKAIKGIDMVFHLAACSDVRRGTGTDLDLEQNIIGTNNVLQCMRLNGVKKIVFTSSQSIYGITGSLANESYGPLLPESLYAASKIACEAYISAFCKLFGMKSWIFRLANIVGRNQTHGVILDFIEKLRKNSKEMEILGDGKQTKSYMLVDDTIDGMLFALKKSDDDVNIFNLGSRDATSATEIAGIVVKEMKLSRVKFRYTGGSSGWRGDVPKTKLSIEKIKRFGWKPKHKSADAVMIATRYLL
jgi:UDP-glucose 4-epimerase